MIRRMERLALHAQDLIGHLGGNRATAPAIRAVVRKEGVKAPLAVGIVPGFDRAGRELHACAVRPFMQARGRLIEIAAPVTMLKTGTRQWTEHAQAPQRDRLLVVASHRQSYSGGLRPLLGGS